MIPFRVPFMLFTVCASALAAEPPNTNRAQASAEQPVQQAPTAPSMGRLFFSPQERAALDEMRRRPAALAAPEPKPLPPAPEYVTLDGVIRRSDGATTVWLNNRRVEGTQTAEGLEVANSKRAPGRGNVTVVVPQTGHSVDLRVGQQLEVTSGKVQERYQLTTPAPASATQSGAEAPAAALKPAPRRPVKDRDLLRELIREIDGPAAERPASPPAAKG